MTTEQKISQLRRITQSIQYSNLIQIAAQDTHVGMTSRIFVKSKDASLGEIGSYNTTKELYVDPKKSPKKFTPKGKTGKSKFKDGADHKTGYFKSYSEYRSKIGRQSNKVNLNLFGDLQSDFGQAVVKLSATKYASIVRDKNVDKVNGAEDRYGAIFKLTKKERDNFKQVLAFETFKIIKNAK